MAADLAAIGENTGINVQACGDMHVANFGVFASAERNLVSVSMILMETLPGPWEWDMKRLVTSVVVSSRFLGAGKDLCAASVRAAVSSYRKRMKQYASMGHMELWYSTIRENDILNTVSPSARKGAEKIMGKARERSHMQVLSKTHRPGG